MQRTGSISIVLRTPLTRIVSYMLATLGKPFRDSHLSSYCKPPITLSFGLGSSDVSKASGKIRTAHLISTQNSVASVETLNLVDDWSNLFLAEAC
jgi:hypothetical protein